MKNMQPLSKDISCH